MFSIIIPTYNRASILERSLTSVLRMAKVEECEIFVVDDGSTDDTPQTLQRIAQTVPGLLTHVRQANAGPGVARNTGLRLATKPRILFLDDDVFPDSALLLAHARLLDRGHDLSQGTLSWHPDQPQDWLIRHMDKHGMQFCFDRITDDANLPYRYVYTANLALSRAAALSIGGFDDALAAQRYAFEDTAFAYKLQKSGHRLALNRQATAFHYHPMTLESLVAREYKVGYTSRVLQTLYPEIAKDLGFTSPSPSGRSLRFAARLAAHPALRNLLGKSLAARIACKNSFNQGVLDYEAQHARA